LAVAEHRGTGNGIESIQTYMQAFVYFAACLKKTLSQGGNATH